MEDSLISLSTLLCTEDDSCFRPLKVERFNSCSISEHDSQYIHMLIRKETIFHPKYSIELHGNWWKRFHGDAAKWILDKRAHFGFHCRTAYLSLIYFDRFLSRRSIDKERPWAIRLLSIACLSLAAKMEECRVPSLFEYGEDEYGFDGNVIQRMELLVLNTLEWKMGCITPFTYLNYFANVFCSELSLDDLIDRAFELLLAIMAEINLVDHRPSIVAAAAVLAAYDDHLSKKMLEMKINAVSSWGPLENEDILFCYSLFQEIGMPKSGISTDLLVIGSSLSDDVVDDSMIRPKNANKRTRVAFINGDQHCPQPRFLKTNKK